MSIKIPVGGFRKVGYKTRFFQLSAVFPPALAILVGWSLFSQMRLEDSVARVFSIAEASLDASIQLCVETGAFIKTGTEEARTRWTRKYAALGDVLNKFDGKTWNNPIAGTMKSNYEDMQALFDRLVTSVGARTGGVPVSQDRRAFDDELASQLTLRADAIAVNAIRLAESAHADAASARNRTDAIIIIFSSILALFMGALAYRAAEEAHRARELVREELRKSDINLSDAGIRLRRAREMALEYERLREREKLARLAADKNRNALSLIFSSADSLKKHVGTAVEGVGAHFATVERAMRDSEETLKLWNGLVMTDKFPAEIAVNDIVKDAIEWSKPVWERPEWTHIEMAVELDPHVPVVCVNRTDLLEAIINVIRNAAEAMPKGGKLTVKTRLEDGSAVIEVSDCGFGMSDAEKDRCLDAFFSTKGPRHAGMGLTVAEAVARQYGGGVSVQSESKKGTSICVRLPASKGAGTAAAECAKTAGAVRPLRVLIADDEQWSRDTLCGFLREDGHTVSVAADGKAALDAFLHGTFDLVITDWAMPDMTGEELTKAVRAKKPGQRIIMATGFSAHDNRVGHVPECADATVTKPISQETLRGVIARVIVG